MTLSTPPFGKQVATEAIAASKKYRKFFGQTNKIFDKDSANMLSLLQFLLPSIMNRKHVSDVKTSTIYHFDAKRRLSQPPIE
jgi:hypothetical protein